MAHLGLGLKLFENYRYPYIIYCCKQITAGKWIEQNGRKKHYSPAVSARKIKEEGLELHNRESTSVIMSYEYRQFTVELSLQHITMVKICGYLWQQSDVVAKVKFAMDSNRQREREIIHYVISKKLDKLVLPTTMKNDLKMYLESMGRDMFEWLRQEELKSNGNNDGHRERMFHFVTNFHWDNFGSVDGRRIVESYVSNKEAIDYGTWRQLCYYCSEDYIRMFSGDVTWTDCKQDDTIYTFFWYYKIHGKFPEGYQFSFARHVGLNGDPDELSEKIINCIVFHHSILQGNPWSTDYCWNQMDEEEKHGIYLNLRSINVLSDCKNHLAVCLHFFGEMSDDNFNIFLRFCLITQDSLFLMNWPWISCIRSWRKMFACLSNHTCLFWKLAFESLKIMNAECGKKFKGCLYQQHRQVFEELWKSNYGKILVNLFPADAMALYLSVVRLKDIRLCQLIFAGDTKTKEELLARVSRYLHFSELGDLEDDFWRDFMAEVLVNDDERQYFKELFE